MNPTPATAGRASSAIDLTELLRRYSDAWHSHDIDAIMSMHTDDTVFQLHNGTAPAVGAPKVRESFQLVLTAYPDLSATQTAVEIGETHAIVQSVMRSSAAGSVVEAEAVDVFRFVDGLISRKDTYLDTAALAG